MTMQYEQHRWGERQLYRLDCRAIRLHVDLSRFFFFDVTLVTTQIYR